MTSAQITKTFNGTPFVFRADGWFNMTKAAQHFGKQLVNFWNAKDTQAYVTELQKVLPDLTGRTSPLDFNGQPKPQHFGSVYETKRGRGASTWAHPKLAVFFARWLDVTMTLAKLDDDERTKLNLGQRGHGAVNAVNESGLYSIIMRSRKPEARAFKKWVTSEVLPTIRKTGGYMAPSVANLAETGPTSWAHGADDYR